ncbi:glycoside hydrolase family 125 protein [Marinilactibacillus sp. XAAS-LB27]|uniref:glycoside hydrolase family 125 protein n=1 Tax=Marinilactibacillus sp. XAAS-LB27 TaxID=3114538 RepID=UPI002E19B133|nr:glycoside hydrolase family 125 protein [Marinilactibacillus sp. XAAS-LB27]
MFNETLPRTIVDFMEEINELAEEKPEWLEIFNNSFLDTLQNTVKPLTDNTTFVLTGDIPAMWLRDSTAQIRPYLFLANKSPEIKQLIKGLIERHFLLIKLDPYANAFNESANGAGHQDDDTEMQAIIWERKYEIDSLCYAVQLAYLYFKETGDHSIFNKTFDEGVEQILKVWKTEQNHEHSSYHFQRDTWREEDTLVNDGKGSPIKETGLTWSGFRPSDDRCIYHYLVPSNMFAVVVLGYLEEIYESYLEDDSKSHNIKLLKSQIDQALKEHAIIENKQGESVFAYEVDGKGNALIMDDANIPNLLSAPYLGYGNIKDDIYQTTRKTILSSENPYYYEGEYASGVGSSHTPEEYIWHMSLAMIGLTSKTKEEKAQMLDLMVETDANKKTLHEGFHKDNPEEYTREWFSWPNMLFCELMLDYFDFKLKGAEI